jgi:hypothetical protein
VLRPRCGRAAIPCHRAHWPSRRVHLGARLDTTTQGSRASRPRSAAGDEQPQARLASLVGQRPSAAAAPAPAQPGPGPRPAPSPTGSTTTSAASPASRLRSRRRSRSGHPGRPPGTRPTPAVQGLPDRRDPKGHGGLTRTGWTPQDGRADTRRLNAGRRHQTAGQAGPGRRNQATGHPMVGHRTAGHRTGRGTGPGGHPMVDNDRQRTVRRTSRPT